MPTTPTSTFLSELIYGSVAEAKALVVSIMKKARLAKDFSQDDLFDLISHSTGSDVVHPKDYEADPSQLNAFTFSLLHNTLEVTADQAFDGVEAFFMQHPGMRAEICERLNCPEDMLLTNVYINLAEEFDGDKSGEE